ILYVDLGFRPEETNIDTAGKQKRDDLLASPGRGHVQAQPLLFEEPLGIRDIRRQVENRAHDFGIANGRLRGRGSRQDSGCKTRKHLRCQRSHVLPPLWTYLVSSQAIRAYM